MDKLTYIHSRLLKIAQAWAAKADYDVKEARELRRKAILILHEHYLKNIPVYQKLAEEEGISELNDAETIKHELMSTDDLFKSYNQEWLDANDFGMMNEWLGTIYHERIEIDVGSVKTIDQWIDLLTAGGITLAYSSGTTGRFSFVPRSERGWYLFTNAPSCYIAPALFDLGIGSLLQKLAVKPAMKFLAPFTFAGLIKKFGLPGYDGVFLNFKKGNMGVQLVAQEFSKLFKNTCFLYDVDLSASAIRLITRGVKTEEDRKLLADFQQATLGSKDRNYGKVIDQLKRSARSGTKVFLFGAPYQFKELVQMVIEKEGQLPLPEGSFMLTGGGWKTFEGQRIERSVLEGMISEAFNVPSNLIVDGYSMTEINATMSRCEHGRYHMPPVLEPVILDEDLVPLEGNDLKGAFGFLDPFALSYPGFMISGDNVRLIDEKCPCGMYGPALAEVGRAPGREIKGCGGIMASVQA